MAWRTTDKLELNKGRWQHLYMHVWRDQVKQVARTENPHYVDWGVAGARLSDVEVTAVFLTNRQTLFVERGGEMYCLCVFPAPCVTGCLTDGFQLAVGAYISCQRLWGGKLAGLKTGSRLERFLAFMLLFSRTWPTSAFTSEWTVFGEASSC